MGIMPKLKPKPNRSRDMKVEQIYGYIIKAEYKGPTNHKGSRIMVKIRNKRYWFDYDYSMDLTEFYTKCISDSFREFYTENNICPCNDIEEYKIKIIGTETGYMGIASK